MGLLRSYSWFFVYTLLQLIIASCTAERYRKDKANRLSRHAEKASDYLAKQSIELTQGNIDNRNTSARKSRKRQLAQQEELNKLNQTTSKVKPVKKHKGNFRFY